MNAEASVTGAIIDSWVEPSGNPNLATRLVLQVAPLGRPESLLIVEESADAPAPDVRPGAGGWGYITFQIFKVDREHAFVLAHGGGEAVAPVTLGTTARISMVKDPAGNWIEISQRASITGSLEP